MAVYSLTGNASSPFHSEPTQRELIDRIDEMSLRGMKLCNPKGTPGSGKGSLARRSARSAIGMLSDILFCRRLRPWRGRRAAVSARADERRLEEGDGAQQELEEWNVADPPEIDSLPEAATKLVDLASQFATK
jgi:hypothetical protein